MINLTRLLFPAAGLGAPQGREGTLGAGLKVIWDARSAMDFYEVRGVIDDLAELGTQVLMFTECDPEEEGLGVLDAAEYAAAKGIRVTLRFQGKLVSSELASMLREIGVAFVSEQLEGPEPIHDYITGVDGSYAALIQSIRNCKAVGLKFNLVFTLNRRTLQYLPHAFQVVEEENVDRLVVAHRVYTQKGDAHLDPSPEQMRQAMDYLIDRAIHYRMQGRAFELFTVDNCCDAIYAYLKTRGENRDRAARIFQQMTRSGGNRSGVSLVAIDRSGYILADPHTPQYTFGNIFEQPFREIWTQARHPVLQGLRNREVFIKGRCQGCRWLPICGGNSRTRAEAVTGDFWESDPQCYLTDAEISTGAVVE